MVTVLAALVVTAAPPTTVRLSSVFLVAGEAGFAATGAQVWVGRADEVGATLPRVLSRFSFELPDLPVVGQMTAIALETRLQEDGWRARVALNAASLSLQGVGAALLAMELFEDEAPEGAVETFRPTRISFRLLDGGRGGVVTLSGVTF